MPIDPSDITPLVLTLDEAANVERTLERLEWARRIVVVDSCSNDGTPVICSRYQTVDLVPRRFDEHAAQWNFGLDQVTTPWVLALDADYVLTGELVRELTAGVPDNAAGYFARFTYCVHGRPLRGSLYPPRLVLFRRDRARYVQQGHTQRLQIDGPTGWLNGRIRHDDRKPIERWVADQLRYSAAEARYLTNAPRSTLSAADRLRRQVVVAPLAVPAYALFAQGVVLDGWHGCYYACQRAIAELLLSMRLVRERVSPGGGAVEPE